MSHRDVPGHHIGMSQDVQWGCPRTSNRDVLRESVTERHWSFPVIQPLSSCYCLPSDQCDIPSPPNPHISPVRTHIQPTYNNGTRLHTSTFITPPSPLPHPIHPGRGPPSLCPPSSKESPIRESACLSYFTTLCASSIPHPDTPGFLCCCQHTAIPKSSAPHPLLLPAPSSSLPWPLAKSRRSSSADEPAFLLGRAGIVHF